MTRDQKITLEIGKAQELVGQLRQQLDACVAHAHGADAIGHEALYAAVSQSLAAAWKALDEAHDVMGEGDPEDFA
jgi:molybdopterin synthase catalytic subunit